MATLAVVSGVSRGIGMQTGLLLARHGIELVLGVDPVAVRADLTGCEYFMPALGGPDPWTALELFGPR